jgi:uncharacterized membrane protein YjjB (DUF3815 family)
VIAMPEKKKEISWLGIIGVLVFAIGLVLAVVLGIVPELTKDQTVLLLGILGIIAGILNVTSEEIDKYLLAGIAFVVAGRFLYDFLQKLPLAGYNVALATIIENILLFVAPAVALIAIKVIYDVAKSK